MTENKTNRYNNSKVYKLVDDEGYYYYGSTCMPLHKRFFDHKNTSKKAKERKIYTIFTYERFLNNEIKIVLVDEFKLQNKEELIREENKYIENSRDDQKCLNLKASWTGLTKKDYNKKWFQDNLEHVAEHKKQYRQANIEHIKEYDKKRDQGERRERMLKYNAQPYTCICGATIRNDSRWKHQKTKSHIEFVNSNSTSD